MRRRPNKTALCPPDLTRGTSLRNTNKPKVLAEYWTRRIFSILSLTTVLVLHHIPLKSYFNFLISFADNSVKGRDLFSRHVFWWSHVLQDSSVIGKSYRPQSYLGQIEDQVHFYRQIITSERKSSLPGSGEEMEITRRFVTRRTKVINKGDRLRTEIDQSLETVFIGNLPPPLQVQRLIISLSEPGLGRQVREYKVVFLGTSNVGKSSIISQFLRTEHDDVFGREFLRLPGRAGDR